MKPRFLGGPFKGAHVLLQISNSKRKLFVIYKDILNRWIRGNCSGKSFSINVGANDDHHTY